jgi:hypothetical protein
MGVLDRGDVHDGQRHPREQSSTGCTASEIEETLRFAALAGVRPMTETSPLDDAQGAYNRMLSGDARFRMVLTAASNQSPAVMLLPNIHYRHRNPARVRGRVCQLNGSVALPVVAVCADISRSVTVDVTDLAGIVFSGLSVLVITMRWKPALNAFAITLRRPLPVGRDLLTKTTGNHRWRNSPDSSRA